MSKIRSLHSRYNPQGEADRYINSLSLNQGIRCFILIEPGLGYMITPLKKRFPGARVIALHAGNNSETGEHHVTVSGGASPAVPDSEWYPDSGAPVQDFLEREIPDSEAAELRILEWRPALSVYGEAYRELVEETAAFIKRSDANYRTLKRFGRTWFSNFFKNINLFRTVLCPGCLSVPFLVTGAGPGLEDAIPFIKEGSRRNGLFILASSSSVAALQARDINPGMVISADGGAWAKMHLYECFRRAAFPFSMAVSLSAALPSQCETLPILPISDGSLWQTLILRELDIPFIALPQRGTVIAAALDLAFALTKNNVFIAGIDLAVPDIRSHARPYSLDRLMEEKEGRLNPLYSQTFIRSSLLKAGGSYSIYASWFKKQIPSYPKRLYSLGKNNSIFTSPENTSFDMGTSESSPVYFKTAAITHKGKSTGKALSILKKALKDTVHSAILREELGALLFPGKEIPAHEEIIDAISTLAARDRGSPHHG